MRWDSFFMDMRKDKLTSTFCEFLIHPGLFWKFSGRDAERLALGGNPDESL